MKSKIQATAMALSIALFILILSGFAQSETIHSDNGEKNKQSTPLGTIITSTLKFDQFIKVTKDRKTFNPKRSKWAPADGRSISLSDYHKLTSKSKSPDLRGQFVRGKNEFLNDGQQPSKPLNGKDVGERKEIDLYSYQTDAIKEHVHQVVVHWNTSHGGNRSYGSNGVGNSTKVNTQGNLNSGKETRPRNMSVYYYIKINN